MQPKIHKHVLCANNVFTILQKHKKGVGCDFTGGGGGQTTPLFFVLKNSAKTLLVHKTCLYSGRLHCLYIYQGG